MPSYTSPSRVAVPASPSVWSRTRPDFIAPPREERPCTNDQRGVIGFTKRMLFERNLYGAMAFAETAESMSLSARALGISRGDRVVGVTSSGDMLLSFLANGAESVVGFDANPTQTALAELKLAAINALDVSEYLQLLGIHESGGKARLRTFDRVSRSMPGAARSLMLRARSAISDGILNHGMTHLIIRTLVNTMRRLVDRETVSLFLGEHGTNEERAAELKKLIKRRATRHMAMPILRALSPQLKWLFFPHRLCRVSSRPDEMISQFFETFEPLFVSGARNNPVLCRSATSQVHPEWRAVLYNEPVFEQIRQKRNNISFTTADLENGFRGLPDGWATRVYLSNVPDYLTERELDELAYEIRRSSAPGARVLYYSLCDIDRLAKRLGPAIPHWESSALEESDTVHLYPSIIVRNC